MAAAGAVYGARSTGGRALRTGLLFGVASVYLCLTGIVESWSKRWVLADTIALGQVVLLAAGVAAGFVAAMRDDRGRAAPRPGGGGVLRGAVAGTVAAACTAALLLLGAAIQLRSMFINASPALYAILTGGRDLGPGAVALLAAGAVCGAAGAVLALLDPKVRAIVLRGLLAVLVLSIFQDLLQLMLQGGGPAALVRGALFSFDGPSISGAALVCGLTWAAGAASIYWGPSSRVRRAPAAGDAGRRIASVATIAIGIVILLLVPVAGGPFVAQVMVLVGLYTLMGLGLNLEVGFAGLLDLGFVAFFAIGAYAMALLTSRGDVGIAHWSFWAAMPVAIAVSLVAGILFGIPVLRVRGDYLAIATLGLGEIVRLLVLSDALRPWLGGSFGVLAIPKPRLDGWELSGPRQLYYLTLVASALVAYVAWRLQDSRLGRAWMAIREDEDVAQALGIDLVSTKLLAYGLGGAMGGMGGAIFATLVGSVFPHSFSLLISINVLVLIILGGLGSLWGVIVGALVLVGLPELLREFGEYRFLVYGIVLVVMMLVRPEGLVPASAQQRELHSEEAPGATRIEVGTVPGGAGAETSGAPGPGAGG